ncbi:Histone deacetylase 3 [Gurleya vavrai]
MKIGYIFDEEVGNFHYGQKHPMKPHRIALTHSLVHSYKLDKKIDIIKPVTTEESKKLFQNYHGIEYIDSIPKFASVDDCPCFPGVMEYCTRYSMASLKASQLINEENYDICINWSGGLHHAKKNEASGFCYINDIVLCIQNLLQKHDKVMYIDIDIHHGDGVEEAFFNSNRVLTLSIHRFGDNFFPGTGEIFIAKDSVINVPLKPGMDDPSYKYIFEPIVYNAVRKFNPNVIVLQCGADSLAADRIGCFNLSIYGHGECVKFVKNLGKKLIVLGGGGYTLRNVSRCWTYETSILCDTEIDNEIPEDNPYYNFYKDESVLHPTLKRKNENMNTRKYLDIVKGYVLENISKV